MKKLVTLALASTMLAGPAFAVELSHSDAFIGQIGNGHSAANVQVGQDAGTQNGTNPLGTPSHAVILQQQAPGGNNGHTALQVQLDPGNSAYTYQSSTYADDQALTWQDGPGNTAVTVQLSTAVGGEEEAFVSRVIQNGSNNYAVNWQSDVPSSATFDLNPTVPTIGINNSSMNVAGAHYVFQGEYLDAPYINGH